MDLSKNIENLAKFAKFAKFAKVKRATGKESQPLNFSEFREMFDIFAQIP